MPRRILEHCVPGPSEAKRILRISRDGKIRMVEQVIRLHSNRDLRAFGQTKVFVQSCVKLRERRPPQDISPGIAKLTGWRYRKCPRIKPAYRRANFGAIWADACVRIADKVGTFWNNQGLQIGIVECEHWGERDAALSVGNSRNLPAA